ncbi:MAG: hypothetical protein HY321_18345 [Armatimonadetes bacterium]|nr:hypothetical protein [Armatimonadota bacterium]
MTPVSSEPDPPGDDGERDGSAPKSDTGVQSSCGQLRGGAATCRALILAAPAADTWLPDLCTVLVRRGYECSVLSDPERFLERLASFARDGNCLAMVYGPHVGSAVSAGFLSFALSYMSIKEQVPPGRIGLMVARRFDPEEMFRSYCCIDAYLGEPLDTSLLNGLLRRWETFAGWKAGPMGASVAGRELR